MPLQARPFAAEQATTCPCLHANLLRLCKRPHMQSDLADGSLRKWEFRTFNNIVGDYYCAPAFLEKVTVGAAPGCACMGQTCGCCDAPALVGVGGPLLRRDQHACMAEGGVRGQGYNMRHRASQDAEPRSPSSACSLALPQPPMPPMPPMLPTLACAADARGKKLPSGAGVH